jgi:hypothetical protein
MGPPSTSLPATSCHNLDSYTPNERGGVQGMDRAITTCCLPLVHRKGNAITQPYIPQHLAGTSPVYIVTTQAPPVVHDPTDQHVKNLGVPKDMMNRHLYLALNPNRHIVHMFKHKVLYDETLA